MVGKRKEKGSACKRCKARLPRGAQRCMKCGAQVFLVQGVDSAEAVRNERERLLQKYKLNEMQKRILSAAASAQEIFVCGKDSTSEGEVKSGEERFHGNEAVAAVAALAGPGLILPHGEDCFRLTQDGAKLAQTLSAEPPAKPAAKPVGDA